MSHPCDDYPPVTCGQCKDLTFARKIAAQIRDGQGDRINSNLKFRHLRDEDRIAYAEYALDPKAYCERHPTLPSAWSEHPAPYDYAALQQHELERQRALEPRVVGRLANGHIFTRWQDCAIGDAVAEKHWYQAAVIGAHGALYVSMCVPVTYQWAPTTCGESPDQPIYTARHTDIERRTFERIVIRDADATHFFWKRTS